MDADFWLGRWRQGRIGFHEGRPNAHLVAFFDRLGLAPGARVLVPLCGKSDDLAWLAARGLRVVGVELVREAADAFFAERGLAPREDEVGPYRRLSAGGVELYVGDVFDLGRAGLGPFDALYDRAALVALPRDDRARYVPLVLGALAPGSKSLVIAFACDPPGEGGPPFHVDEAEVRSRFGATAAVALLADEPGARVSDDARKRGVERARELAFLVTKAAGGAGR
jgi:thiopurine S-methyltransferase